MFNVIFPELTNLQCCVNDFAYYCVRMSSKGIPVLKKCHSCGLVEEDGENLLREFEGEIYCIFCLDEKGTPLAENAVRSSIRLFWAHRMLKDGFSKSNAA